MITIIEKGNIFEANTEALVNPVNCVGVMGKGLAKEFANRYPLYYKAYQLACKRGDIDIGRVGLFKDLDGIYKISFPTKYHWRNPSKRTYISQGLQSLIYTLNEHEIKSIAIPALGCGLGGLEWSMVKRLIQTAFEPFSHLEVKLYAPQ